MRCFLVLCAIFCTTALALGLPTNGTSQAFPTNPTKNGKEKNGRSRSLDRLLLFSGRRSKFPIIPPRLKITSTTVKPSSTTSESTIVDNSTSTNNVTNLETKNVAKTSSRNSTRTARHSIKNTTKNSRNSIKYIEITTGDPVIIRELENNDTKQLDIFLQSSSDTRSVAWPVPRRPASRRLWSPVRNRPKTRILPKLLLPKPTRPAMYSLDGFVPKPSIVRITTTEAPPHIKRIYSTNHTKSTRRKEQDSRQSVEEKVNRFSKKNSSRKNVSKFTAFARRGAAGEDYPIYGSIPSTSFDCASKPGPGLYADPETGCQIWHMCPGNTPHRYSFLCPNGTIFSEQRGICDWWYNVPCNAEYIVTTSSTKRRYGRSADDIWLLEGAILD